MLGQFSVVCKTKGWGERQLGYSFKFKKKLPKLEKSNVMTVTMQLCQSPQRAWIQLSQPGCLWVAKCCNTSRVHDLSRLSLEFNFCYSVCSLFGFSFTFTCFLPFQSRECPKLRIMLAKTTDSARKIWYSALLLKMPNSAHKSAGTIGTRLPASNMSKLSAAVNYDLAEMIPFGSKSVTPGM